jgi:metal-dependent hydrolase (beta-lactamase superfamily II)
MCTDDTPAHHAHPVLHEVEPSVVFDLEPVDSVVVTTLMDNVTDVFMPDQGPAHRPPVVSANRCLAATMEGGEAPEQLLAEHGFSVLVTVTKHGRQHRILFDAGASPDGVVENMRRLDVDPSDIEVIVCSHGHFDHLTGLDGLIRRLGTVNLPVLIHPHFWRRRRVRGPLVGHKDVGHVVHQGRHEDRVDRFKIEDRRGLHLVQDLMAVASRRVVSAHHTIMDHDGPLDRRAAAGLAEDVAAVLEGVSSCQCGTPGRRARGRRAPLAGQDAGDQIAAAVDAGLVED